MRSPLVCADIGLNHNASIGVARETIHICAQAGVDYIKLQKRGLLGRIYTQDYLDKESKSQWGSTKREEREALEFDKRSYDYIDAFCNDLGIRWFASPWCLQSVDFLMEYDVPFIKIASACLSHEKLRRSIQATGKTVVLSTGMSSGQLIDEVVEQFHCSGQLGYLLHCSALYPCPDEAANMQRMQTLELRYGFRAAIGFSNHSPHTRYMIQAAAMGAKMIEFHVTFDKALAGPDHAASIDPSSLRDFMGWLDSFKRGYGDGAIDSPEPEYEKGKHYVWR